MATTPSINSYTLLRAIRYGFFHLICNFCIRIKQYCLFTTLIHAKDLWTYLHTGLAAVTLIDINDDKFPHPFFLYLKRIFPEIPVRLHRINTIKTGQAVIFCSKPGSLNQTFQTEIMERIQAKISGRLLY